jgi:GR25 family glycosyltransferase involved in LPS biosynthesis
MFIIILIILLVIIFVAYIININSKITNINKITKVFVINLKKRKERLKNFIENYNLRIPFEIFNAIDGTTLNLSKLITENIIGNIGIESIKNTKRKYHYELTNINAIGCFLSHCNIWKLILEKDIFLIFEDDTIFNEININEINYRISQLPKNWDIYLLSNPELCYSKIKINKNLFKVKRFFLTNAYIINKRAIIKIFNSNTLFPINQQLDSYISDLTEDFNLNIYIHNNYRYYKQSNKFITDIQDNSQNLSFDRLSISYPSYNNIQNLSHYS